MVETSDAGEESVSTAISRRCHMLRCMQIRSHGIASNTSFAKTIPSI